MDRQGLRREIERFDAGLPIEESRTPPSSWYLQPAFIDAEHQAVFARSWHFAARAEQVATPGAYVALEVGDQPVVVVRGDDGVLRAFHNVCRHHATCVAHGEGVTEVLTCPYHGWSYRLDGALAGAPGMGKVAGFDRGAMSLPSVAVVEWGRLVFVNTGDDGSDLRAELAELESMLDASGWGDLRYTCDATYTLDCNWKVFVDNYLDGGYHIASAHKSLAEELDMSQYRTECHDSWSVQLCPDSGNDRLEGGAIYAWLYPNFMINRYGSIMDTNLVIPRGPDRCEVRIEFYFRDTEGEGAQRVIEECLAASDRIQREDVGLCANVQRGLRSSSYDTGVYAQSETGMLAFHRRLRADLAAFAGG